MMTENETSMKYVIVIYDSDRMVWQTKVIVFNLRQRGVNVIALNHKEIGKTWKINLLYSGGDWYSNSFFQLESGLQIPLSEIKSIFRNYNNLPKRNPFKLTIKDNRQDHLEIFDNTIKLLQSKIIFANPLVDYPSSNNKFYGIIKATEFGFKVPSAYFGNNVEMVKKLSNNLAVKPIKSKFFKLEQSDILLYTQKFSQDEIELYKDSVSETPLTYQDYIEKMYELRITVVGDKVFATKIDSQKNPQSLVDWRQLKEGMGKYYSIYTLPKNIQDMCVAYTKSLKQYYGAIDLIRDVNGDYIFLELNSMPAWLWIEKITNQPITNEIVNLLCDPNPEILC